MRAIATEFDLAEAGTVARGHVYSFLAAALADARRRHFQLALDRGTQTVAVAAAELLASEAPEALDLGPGECSPRMLDLHPVVTALDQSSEDIARGHLETFGLLIGKNAPPYETEYCRSSLTFYRAQQLADIAGFYLAFGFEPNREEPERQDHISVELEFMARVIGKELFAERSTEEALQEKAAICREAQKNFFEAHLGCWTPKFTDLMRQAAPPGLYAALADVLASFITSERAFFGLAPPPPLAELQPKHEADVEADCCWSCPAAENQQRRTHA